jgi:hypothetical protein
MKMFRWTSQSLGFLSIPQSVIARVLGLALTLFGQAAGDKEISEVIPFLGASIHTIKESALSIVVMCVFRLTVCVDILKRVDTIISAFFCLHRYVSPDTNHTI